jgi:hypothetical protein
MKTLRIIMSILLAIGGMLVFNESNSITPNFIGILCLALLVVINIDKDTLEKLQR